MSILFHAKTVDYEYKLSNSEAIVEYLNGAEGKLTVSSDSEESALQLLQRIRGIILKCKKHSEVTIDKKKLLLYVKNWFPVVPDQTSCIEVDYPGKLIDVPLSDVERS